VLDAHKLIRRFRVTDGKSFKLSDYDPGAAPGRAVKKKQDDLLAASVAALSEMQEKLWAQDRWSLLIILQAMDAAGKDSVIKHVMSGVNPQGCEVYGFKAPSPEDLDHDFFWRAASRLPERGRIGIFNRSYYEEVLVVRVHRDLLQSEKIPKRLVTDRIWEERFEDINGFERYLARNGTAICKFFLNMSKDVQRKRLLARLEDPAKNWKFDISDVHEREHWDEYMAAFEDMIRHTSSPEAPWYIVPADKKWFAHVVVATAIVDALERLDLHFPTVSKARKRELASIRKAL